MHPKIKILLVTCRSSRKKQRQTGTLVKLKLTNNTRPLLVKQTNKQQQNNNQQINIVRIRTHTLNYIFQNQFVAEKQMY